jgi:hypothetical protein
MEGSRTEAASSMIRMHARVLRGASDAVLHNGDLRDRVRAALAHGQLPAVDGTAWAGPGTGQVCSVCALAIQPSDVEYEVRDGESRLYAHLVCYTIWSDESFARPGDSHSSAGR